jgi:hypothetical protein
MLVSRHRHSRVSQLCRFLQNLVPRRSFVTGSWLKNGNLLVSTSISLPFILLLSSNVKEWKGVKLSHALCRSIEVVLWKKN